MVDSSQSAGGGIGALTRALRQVGVRGVDGGLLHADDVFAALGGVGFHYLHTGEGRAARVVLHGQAASFDAATPPVLAAARALGARVEVQAWPEIDVALEGLRARVRGGDPVLVWVDRGSVPYDPMPRGYQRLLPHLVGVAAVDDDTVVVLDRSAAPLPMDRLRFRLMWSQCSVEPPTALIFHGSPGAAADPEQVAERLRAGLAAHLGAPLGNRGLAGIRTLAARIRSPGHAASWRRAFARGVPIFQAHAALHRFVEEGVGPGFGRGRLAGAVRRLGAAFGTEALTPSAEAWLAAGNSWRQIARDALPDDVPGLGEARLLLELRMRRLLDEGLEGAAFLAATSERLSALVTELDTQFPLDAAALAFRHAELAASLERVAAAEGEAAQALLAELSARGPRNTHSRT